MTMVTAPIRGLEGRSVYRDIRPGHDATRIDKDRKNRNQLAVLG